MVKELGILLSIPIHVECSLNYKSKTKQEQLWGARPLEDNVRKQSTRKTLL